MRSSGVRRRPGRSRAGAAPEGSAGDSVGRVRGRRGGAPGTRSSRGRARPRLARPAPSPPGRQPRIRRGGAEALRPHGDRRGLAAVCDPACGPQAPAQLWQLATSWRVRDEDRQESGCCGRSLKPVVTPLPAIGTELALRVAGAGEHRVIVVRVDEARHAAGAAARPPRRPRGRRSGHRKVASAAPTVRSCSTPPARASASFRAPSRRIPRTFPARVRFVLTAASSSCAAGRSCGHRSRWTSR